MSSRNPWIAALALGTVGGAVLYNADPGINAVIWTSIAAGAVVLTARKSPSGMRKLVAPLGFAIAIAGTDAITTDSGFHTLVFLLVASLLGTSVLLAADAPALAEYNTWFMTTAPFRALTRSLIAILAMLSRARAGRHMPRGSRMRGLIIATPVAILFFLTLSAADPSFASARDTTWNTLTSLSFFPRLVFGTALGLLTLGATSVASGFDAERHAGRDARLAHDAQVAGAFGEPIIVIDATERAIVVGAVAAVTWLFVLFQISYLFRSANAVAASHLTFAEYARRGFGEMALAATLAILLIVATHSRLARRESQANEASLTITSLALLAAACLILVSAFHRVTLYEAEYGFTTSRVDAQAYMIATLFVLGFVVRGVVSRLDTPRLSRQIACVALTTVCVLGYWNNAEWVATKNIIRYQATGKIDPFYLAGTLGEDAYPVVARSLAVLPAVVDTTLRNVSHNGFTKRFAKPPERWFEWNMGREAARGAIARLDGGSN